MWVGAPMHATATPAGRDHENMGFSTESFETQFERVEGGYILYPSSRQGGVMVTDEERRSLVARYRSAGGLSTKRIKAFFCAIVVTGALAALIGPDDPGPLIYLPMYLYLVWQLFDVLDAAILAPRRVAARREEAAPPQARSESRRLVERAMPWVSIFYGLILTGLIGSPGLVDSPTSWAACAMTMAIVPVFAGYAWLAVRKLGTR
jgi:hypothetical protein